MSKLQIVVSACVTAIVLVACAVIIFVSVPDVMGQTVQEAQAELEALGFYVDVETVFNEADKGVVLASEPATKKLTVKHSAITLTVSDGNNVMPDVMGQDIDQAKQALAQLGINTTLEVRCTAPNDGEIDKAITLSKPSAGVGLNEDDHIVLYQSTAYGNTSGNIQNNGLLVQQNNMLYYHNDGDEGKLYRQDLATGAEQKLCDDWVSSINVIGDWIYYENDSDCHRIYKIKIDGSDRQKISDDAASYLIAEGEWIYYRNNTDFGRLYRIKNDGTENDKLSEDIVININVSGDTLIYRTDDEQTKQHIACQINKDGSNRQVISGDEEWSFINVVDNAIYYQNKSKARTIYVKDLANGESKPLNNDISAYINVIGEWIYYQNVSNNYALYRMRTDGTQKQQVLSEQCAHVNVSGDYILYQNTQEDDLWYLMQIDTLDKQLMSQLPQLEENENIESGKSSGE